MPKYFPVMLDLSGLDCLVVGGGEVAARKVHSLLECGAKVTVLSPDIDIQLKVLNDKQAIAWLPRPYQPDDITGFYLVICATNHEAVNRQVAEECQRAQVLVNVVDDPKNCNFLVPSIMRRGDLVIAVSTGGASPVAARQIRHELESRYGPEYEAYLQILTAARQEVLQKVPDPVIRRKIFEQLADGRLLKFLQDGQAFEAKEWVKQCLSLQWA